MKAELVDERLLTVTPDTVGGACQWIAQWLPFKQRVTKDSAVAAVFDIDSTLLRSRQGIIKEVVALLEQCKSLGICVFLVTARKEGGRRYTLDELDALGIRGFGGSKNLFMLPDHAEPTRQRVGLEKSLARQKVAKKGFRVILNAGDAWTDHYEHREVSRELRNHRGALLFIDRESGCVHLKMPETA